MLKPVVISAPFGNYFSYPGATSTLGTFTLKHRGGPWKRLWRCALTLRPLWRAGGWINRLGLPNPGIDSLDDYYVEKIVSVHGFRSDEWYALTQTLIVTDFARCAAVEFNLSCPNVGHKPSIGDVEDAVRLVLDSKTSCVPIAKLPPVRWMDYVDPLYALGVRHFHCCNTIPTPGGGISGKPLKQYVMWAIDDIKGKHPDAVVIAGGGVTCLEDVKDYVGAGASHVAIGSALLNPLRWRTIRRLTQCQFDLEKRTVYYEH